MKQNTYYSNLSSASFTFDNKVVHFRGDGIRGSIFSTNAESVQNSIEKSTLFGKVIFLKSSVDITPNKIEVIPDENQISTGESNTDTGVEYPDVKNIQEANSVLKILALEKGLPYNSQKTIVSIKQKAFEFGISFPNL